MRVFHTRKLKDLMSAAGVKTYTELAELSRYSVATIRKARRTGVPYYTARFIVQELLAKFATMEKSTSEKPYGGKSVGDVLNEVTYRLPHH